jgi:hypothetical protein
LRLPVNDFDIATISQQRASSQFRITLDTNRYSVPAEYAGRRLTVKTYPQCRFLNSLFCIHRKTDVV